MPCAMENQYLLQTPWTFWYDYRLKKNVSHNEWKDGLHQIATVTDVPSLLYAAENIEPLNTWPTSSNLYLFREDIKPAWEDKYNILGGKWIYEIMKGDERVDLQEIWKKSIAFVISEQIPDEVICGVVFSPRKFINRFAVWTCEKNEEIIDLGKEWRDLVAVPEYNEFVFRSHQDNLEGGQYWNKNLYTL